MQYATNKVTVSVPATSANLGPGFDCMGLSLALRDEVTIEATVDPSIQISITGEGQETLPTDEHHLMVQAVRKTQEYLGFSNSGLKLTAMNRIPQARGLGSSAATIVAGVAAAMAFSGKNTENNSRDIIFDIASQIEGHPDNVAPAVYGGLTVSWDFNPQRDIPSSVSHPPKSAGIHNAQMESEEDICHIPQPLHDYRPGYHTVNYPVDSNIRAVVFVPTQTLSTHSARTILPEKLPYDAAPFNAARAAMLPYAFGNGDSQRVNHILYSATQDRIHQDYRKELMPDSWQLMMYLRSLGYAATISGAGPCVLVVHSGDISSKLAEVTQAEWCSTGRWSMRPLDIDTKGVEISCEV